MTRIRGPITAGLALALLVLTACAGPDTPPENTTVDEQAQQFSQLMQRPDIDQATARYEQMYGRIRDAVAAAVPSLKAWQITNPAGGSACGNDFAAVDADLRRDDAVIKGLNNWTAAGNIPDGKWLQVVDAVHAIAADYGFGTTATTVNRPSDHEVVFHDQYEAELNFGPAVNTTLLLRTGCHLTAEAKKRGAPAPRPTY
ncbi:hypothetical protein GCM10022222_17490 [Amycolatopsis ultiminotia]|uniref:LppA-like lipoprotein n=1 Tax=Amycolatopsis ultiminotia TaxID=543629 RepID=A0ABP6VG92_9PSEU